MYNVSKYENFCTIVICNSMLWKIYLFSQLRHNSTMSTERKISLHEKIRLASILRRIKCSQLLPKPSIKKLPNPLARVIGEVSKINKVNTIEFIGTKLH